MRALLRNIYYKAILFYHKVQVLRLKRKKKINVVHPILSIFIPFYSIYYSIALSKEIKVKADELNIQIKRLLPLHIVFNTLFLNIVSIIILQIQLNKIAKYQNAIIDTNAKEIA